MSGMQRGAEHALHRKLARKRSDEILQALAEMRSNCDSAGEEVVKDEMERRGLDGYGRSLPARFQAQKLATLTGEPA